MSPLLCAALPYLIGAALLAAAILGVRWYGASQYQAGANTRQVEIEKRQAAIEGGRQEEKTVRKPNTAGPCSRASKRKPRSRHLSVNVPLPLVVLLGCSSSLPAGAPRNPAPAAELMDRAATGSAYLENVSRELKALGDDLVRWEQTLRDSLTK